jgi:hypothetical protein
MNYREILDLLVNTFCDGLRDGVQLANCRWWIRDYLRPATTASKSVYSIKHFWERSQPAGAYVREALFTKALLAEGYRVEDGFCFCRWNGREPQMRGQA